MYWLVCLCVSMYVCVCVQLSIDNGLGSRNNVVDVEKKHFDAFFETWEMTSSDKSESALLSAYMYGHTSGC